jgi:hypothetical protein
MKLIVFLLIGIVLMGFICYLLWQLLLLSYKVGYYEQKLRNMRHFIPDNKWADIERMMKVKNPFE